MIDLPTILRPCGSGFRLAGILLASILALPGAATAAVNGYVEITANEFDTEREESDGQRTESRSESFVQRYNVNLDHRLFPNLWVRSGGLFERTGSTFMTTLQDTDTTTTKLRPFLNLSLRLPLHTIELNYDRAEDRQRTVGAPTNAEVRETYGASFAFNPDVLPTFRLDYLRTNQFDRDRLFRDSSQDQLQLGSHYSPLDSLRLTLRSTLNETDDRLNDNLVRTLNHTARVDFLDTYFDRRVRVNADYNWNYRSTKTTTSGLGEVRFPVLRVAGLSSIDDTPDRDALDSSPGLVDGNLSAAAGINLLLPPTGGDERPRNIGLDFTVETEVNSLLVWVDSELGEVFESFAWDVWISEDNENWVEWILHGDPDLSVEFGPFLRRFEIDFPTTVTRYIKLVVTPVRPVELLPDTFPSILVTELQAELRRQAADIGRKESGSSHLLSGDIRTRILESVGLYHELTYSLSENDTGPTQYRYSNGLSLLHPFNDVYSTSARVAHERSRQSGGERTAVLYSAALVASPLETLQHRLVLSGREESGPNESRDTRSVFLLSTAKLYRGIDINVGSGLSTSEQPTGEITEVHELNASGTVVPHRTVTFNLAYRDQSSETSGGERAFPDQRDVRSHEIRVAYNPLSTLYLYGSYRSEERTGLQDRTIGNYSMSWSPFPDGTLQISLRYDELLRSEDDAEETIFSPRLRWNFARGSYLDLAYQQLTTRSAVQRVDNEILSGNLRFAF